MYITARITFIHIKCFAIYIKTFPLTILWEKHAVVFGARPTTAQLYHGRDTYEFDKGHVTKNPPITVLVLLSESLSI